jgi:hypothetical protein
MPLYIAFLTYASCVADQTIALPPAAESPTSPAHVEDDDGLEEQRPLHTSGADRDCDATEKALVERSTHILRQLWRENGADYDAEDDEVAGRVQNATTQFIQEL